MLLANNSSQPTKEESVKNKKTEIRIGVFGCTVGKLDGKSFRVGRELFVFREIPFGTKRTSAPTKEKHCHFRVVHNKRRLRVDRLDYTPPRTKKGGKELRVDERWQCRNASHENGELVKTVRKKIGCMLDSLGRAGRRGWFTRVGE
ncbi:MAG: hypothetical protein UY50_C0023G0034 [Parcubacteria group bacterium GW2011_GWA2_49_9]|nr:MAG: hypothetical protein UY50_C0023G0034 [Parcubacteria group bacterium GW2011_GWA2_49_9]